MKNLAILLLFALNLQSFYELENTAHNGIIFHSTNQNPPLVQQNILDELLNDLSNFQQRAFAYSDEFFDKLEAIEKCQSTKLKQKLYTNLERRFCEYSEDQPLFLLSECGSRNRNKNWIKQCPLERHLDPCEGLRHRFFLRVIQSFSAQPQLNPKGATIIFYASGGALFEMQILAGFSEKGLRFSNVILIDPDYSFSVKDVFNMNNRSFSQIDVTLLRKLYRHIQLCNFVWSLNPETNILVYKKSDDYLSDVNDEIAPRGSMLIAMDPISGTFNTKTGIFLGGDAIIAELNYLKNSLSNQGATAVAYRRTGHFHDVDNDNSVFLTTEINGYCAWCNEKADKNCGVCKSTSYCTKDHQTQDWPHHKQFCKKR